MAAYRIYEAKFPFVARETSELTINEGDTVFVYEKPNGGGWPDSEKWMKGMNSTTGKTGDFPGTYCKFVDEVAPAPPPVAEHTLSPSSNSLEEDAPPVPPRRPKSSLGE